MSRKKEVKKASYTIALYPGIKSALEKAAIKKRTSVSALLEALIIQYLDSEQVKWTEKG